MPTCTAHVCYSARAIDWNVASNHHFVSLFSCLSVCLSVCPSVRIFAFQLVCNFIVMLRLFSNIPLKWQLFYYIFSHVWQILPTSFFVARFVWYFFSWSLAFCCAQFFLSLLSVYCGYFVLLKFYVLIFSRCGKWKALLANMLLLLMVCWTFAGNVARL